MTNNEILRRIQESLVLGEDQVSEIFRQSSLNLDPASRAGLFLEAETTGHVPCPDPTLVAFLDGLIAVLRGVGDGPKRTLSSDVGELDNSDILKKLRIALDMHHSDVVATLARTGVNPTKTDLTAWFRKKGTSQYRPCSDAALRAFLSGYRPPRRPRLQGPTVVRRGSAAGPG